VEEERTKCKKFKLQLLHFQVVNGFYAKLLKMCVSVKRTNAWCAFGCSSKGLSVDYGKME
jgi:hypothetical protein